MAGQPLNVFWTRVALRDLHRFVEFLRDSRPQLALEIAEAIISAADILADLPLMGRKVSGEPFRQVILPVRNASYVVRYRVGKHQVVILRVFHGREERA